MTPTQAMHHLETDVMDAYATGVFVDRPKGIAPALPAPVGPASSPGACAAAAPARRLPKMAGHRVEE